MMPPRAAAPPRKQAECLYDYEAADDTELSFAAGDVIFIEETDDPDWPI